ncbi:tRNA-splicing endonuclease subunit Sen34-like, partial [Leucoraja erinacea]|uniref:tRNA-splicing endonuclease subunit Sen34-like n=1 Tax=Leucoraja erinaceus TaxID=7782 RepID=UPI002453F895
MRREEEGDGDELACPRQRALPPLPACRQVAAPLPGLHRGQALAGAAAAAGGGGGGCGGRQAALEVAAEEEEAELAMLLIHMSTGFPLVVGGASGLVRALRERGLLTGRAVGSLPRSNGRLGLPLQLLPEEALLLTQRGLALMVGAAGEGEGGQKGQGDLARARSKAEGEWRSDLTGSEGGRGMDPPEARREELGKGERLRDLAERKREGEEEGGERRRNPMETSSEGEEERRGDPTQARREGEKGHGGLTVGGSEGEWCRSIVERMGEGEREGRSGDPTDAGTEGGGALDRSYGLQRYFALERRRRELSVHQLRIQNGRQIKRRREAQD